MISRSDEYRCTVTCPDCGEPITSNRYRVRDSAIAAADRLLALHDCGVGG